MSALLRRWPRRTDPGILHAREPVPVGVPHVRTEDIALVEAIGGDDCVLLALTLPNGVVHALVMRRLGWPAPSMMVRRQTAAGRQRWTRCGATGGSQSAPECELRRNGGGRVDYSRRLGVGRLFGEGAGGRGCAGCAVTGSNNAGLTSAPPPRCSMLGTNERPCAYSTVAIAEESCPASVRSRQHGYGGRRLGTGAWSFCLGVAPLRRRERCRRLGICFCAGRVQMQRQASAVEIRLAAPS